MFSQFCELQWAELHGYLRYEKKPCELAMNGEGEHLNKLLFLLGPDRISRNRRECSRDL